MSPPATSRPGHTLVELLAVVGVLAAIAALAIARMADAPGESKSAACAVHRGNIEVQAELWRHHHGSWPEADLSDLAGDAAYFPAGAPVCPVDGSAYAIDSAGRVVGHAH